jgi:hypothetical protein
MGTSALCRPVMSRQLAASVCSLSQSSKGCRPARRHEESTFTVLERWVHDCLASRGHTLTSSHKPLTARDWSTQPLTRCHAAFNSLVLVTHYGAYMTIRPHCSQYA